MARKPEQHASLLRYSTGKGWRVVAEPLPREQKDLELAMVRKVLPGINRLTGYGLHSPRVASEEPADVIVDSNALGLIQIQVTEVRHEASDRMHRDRLAIEQAILRAMPTPPVWRPFNVLLSDKLPELPLPGSRDPALQSLQTAFCDAIRNGAVDLPETSSEEIVEVAVPFDDAPDRFRVTFWGKPKGGLSPPKWINNHLSGSDVESMCVSAIERKARRGYSGGGGRFWLLLVGPNVSTDVAEYVALHMQSLSHPFSAIWAMSPVPYEDNAVFTRIWTRNWSVSRA